MCFLPHNFQSILGFCILHSLWFCLKDPHLFTYELVIQLINFSSSLHRGFLYCCYFLSLIPVVLPWLFSLWQFLLCVSNLFASSQSQMHSCFPDFLLFSYKIIFFHCVMVKKGRGNFSSMQTVSWNTECMGLIALEFRFTVAGRGLLSVGRKSRLEVTLGVSWCSLLWALPSSPWSKVQKAHFMLAGDQHFQHKRDRILWMRCEEISSRNPEILFLSILEQKRNWRPI